MAWSLPWCIIRMKIGQQDSYRSNWEERGLELHFATIPERCTTMSYGYESTRGDFHVVLVTVDTFRTGEI